MFLQEKKSYLKSYNIIVNNNHYKFFPFHWLLKDPEQIERTPMEYILKCNAIDDFICLNPYCNIVLLIAPNFICILLYCNISNL